MKHFIYILYSEQLNRYYTGSTSLPVTYRLNYHLSNHGGFTSKANDWTIIYEHQVQNVEDARSLEKKIKKRGARRYLEDLTTP